MSERVRVDGRTARAQRTRAAIVDAHLGLLASGDLKPTGERIADAAGVSLRTLWTSFKDMETLFSAAGQRLIERQLEVFEPIDRGAAVAGSRRRVLPAAGADAGDPGPGGPRGRALRAVLRGAAAQPDDRARAASVTSSCNSSGSSWPMPATSGEELLRALHVTSTFASWNVLRDNLGLSVDAARGVMRRTVAALLGLP